MFPVALSGGNGLGYQIQRSLRLRASATAYATRTFGTPTNNLRWTYSVWFKKGVMNAGTILGSAGAGNGSVSNTFQYLLMDFNGSQGGQLEWRQVNGVGTITAERQPTMLLRDPSAWYHLVCVWDSANGTAADRMIMYVNGVRVSSFTASTDPSAALTSYVNTNGYIIDMGAVFLGGARGGYFDGYLSEVNFIDGQALTPTSFGQTDPTTGVWTAKKYTGTFGTNGFYLDFSTTTSPTTLCNDKSGNGNNWTPNNISTTAGATYDSMLDVPLAYGTTDRGNYATLNPLRVASGSMYINSANTTVTGAADAAASWWPSTLALTGKHYMEYLAASNGGYGAALMGVVNLAGTIAAFKYAGTGGDYSAYGVYGLAFDLATGNIWFRDTVGAWIGGGNPELGTTPTTTIATTDTLFFAIGHSRSSGFANVGATYANFGQRPFTYTPPTGFKSLHTGNLQQPTILKPNKHFDVVTHSGNSGTQVISGVGFQSDLIWVKARNGAVNHQLQDSVRGMNLSLASSTTGAESDNTTVGVTATSSTGFTMGTGSAFNASGSTYVDWLWKAGGAAVTNTAGSISAQVSANASAGFSIVTYTGTGANATVGHGLGVAPVMIILKNRANAAANWVVFNGNLTAPAGTKVLLLNTTNATLTDGTAWNSAYPTSSVFSLGANTNTNGSGQSHVAYCFAEIAGYSKFGSYTGNGSADGPFVYCGFRPRYVMVKCSSTTGNWNVFDTARDASNVGGNVLYPNLSNAEAGGSVLDITANGFKFRNTGGDYNVAQTYIFMALAESPFQYSLAR